jgi:hypothetical protein
MAASGSSPLAWIDAVVNGLPGKGESSWFRLSSMQLKCSPYLRGKSCLHFIHHGTENTEEPREFQSETYASEEVVP